MVCLYPFTLEKLVVALWHWLLVTKWWCSWSSICKGLRGILSQLIGEGDWRGLLPYDVLFDEG